MLTKLFLLIETYKDLKKFVTWVVSEWVEFQIKTYGGNLDEKQSRRNAIIDAIELAQENRDGTKMLEYSRLLALEQ